MLMLAWRNLLSHRLCSLLGVVAVMLGVSITIAGVMITDSVRDGVLRTEELVTLMDGLISMLDPMMLFVGIVLLMAGGFLIFNTFGMAVTNRYQQIGSLRALGMTRSQIMRLFITEGLLLGVIGVVLGVLMSVPMSRALIATMGQIAGKMLVFGEASPRLAVISFAAVAGLVMTLLSVWIPARRAARISPLDALREPNAGRIEGAGRGQTIGGLLLMGALLAYAVIAKPGEWTLYPVDSLLTLGILSLWLTGLILILPAVIGLAARVGQRILSNSIGRMITDNLQRARARVSLTVLTLAFALMVLVMLTGFLKFLVGYGFTATMESGRDQQAMIITRLNILNGWGTIIDQNLDTIYLSDDELTDITTAIDDRALAVPIYFAVAPELSFIGDAYFSYIVDPQLLPLTRDTLFTFSEGDWQTALPIMESGCGVLISPAIAARHNVRIGDRFMVTGRNGNVECTVAGLGVSVAGCSIISGVVRDQFADPHPIILYTIPTMDTDQLVIDLQALSNLYIIPMTEYVDTLGDVMDIIALSISVMLVLTAFVAAFGVINTMMISIHERRNEIHLLRAVGTTRRQTRRIIIGEATLMGIIGGGIGFCAGIGAIILIVFTYGLNSFSASLDLWEVAVGSIQPTLPIGMVGLMASPVIAGLAAWLPIREILKEPHLIV